MKITIITILTLALFVPLAATADEYFPDAAPVMYYQFSVTWTSETPTLAGMYSLVTGDPALPIPGTWELQVLNEKGRPLATYPFMPGTRTMTIPYEGSGFRMHMLNEQRVVRLNADLSGSRVCDDNGTCDAQYGENADNCSSDCGTSQNTAQQAAASNQFAATAGALLWAGGLAAAGVLVLLAARSSMDKGRRL